MTAIVGLRHARRVWIGGDSAGVSGYDITVRADSKVFRNGPYVMGFTSSFRMGQLLRYKDLPEPEGDLERFMVTTFIDRVRAILTEGGWLTKSSEREGGGTFLVGVGPELFTVYSDFQVARSVEEYAAVGCGEGYALGSFHSTRGRAAKARLTMALDAAAHHSAGVTGPYSIEVTKA